ncbi:MAG: sugar ABC transporter substrate-binding protein [bacterium]|nr:sugar ABC transporter substrate-binding protein [bacterium]
MKSNLFRCLSTALCLAIMLGGCGRGKSEDQGKITVTIACGYSPTDVGSRLIDKSLDEFMKQNPDIEVKKIWFTSKDYFTKLMVMIAGGNPPDIFRLAPDYIPIYVQRGTLEPLDRYIVKSNKLKLEEFYPQVLYKYKYETADKTIGQGPVYGFGTDWSPDYTLFYNKDMFDKAGLPYPKGSMSWEEFRQTALKLSTGKGGQRRYGCLIGDIPLLVAQNGGSLFSSDGKRCLLDSQQAIEAFQYLVDLKVKDRVMPSAGDLQSSNYLQLFQSGRLGMFLSARFLVPILEEQVKGFEWGVAPGLHQKKRVNMVTGPYGWVMSSKVKHPEAAWKLMEHLVVGDCEKGLAKAGYNIPVIKKTAESEMFLHNPDHPDGINEIFMNEVKYAVPSPLTPYAPADRWKTVISRELELAYLGKQTARQAALNAASKINELLAEGLKK